MHPPPMCVGRACFDVSRLWIEQTESRGRGWFGMCRASWLVEALAGRLWVEQEILSTCADAPLFVLPSRSLCTKGSESGIGRAQSSVPVQCRSRSPLAGHGQQPPVRLERFSQYVIVGTGILHHERDRLDVDGRPVCCSLRPVKSWSTVHLDEERDVIKPRLGVAHNDGVTFARHPTVPGLHPGSFFRAVKEVERVHWTQQS